jgi:hypothetical protein
MNKFFRTLERDSPNICIDLENPLERRLLGEYGAVLVAGDGVTPPDRLIFRNSAEVNAFQNNLQTRAEELGGYDVELQSAAMEKLLNAAAEATAERSDITPRGADSARRGYDETVSLWLSRVLPGLEHWLALGRLSAEQAEHIRSLSAFDQVSEVLMLEEQGVFFSKDLSKSIMYSVAPPGTSQHLSMLAIDIAEFNDARTREIMASHGWFQTVISDLPHFTYLGVDEAALPDLGLKKVLNGDRGFWIPDLDD